MKQYKGYYIDGVHFTNTAEIDKFIENQAVEAFIRACKVFNINMNLEASIYAGEKAEILVKEFGYTWGDIEDIEIKVLKSEI